MFTGLGSLSIVKRQTANSLVPAIGFQKTQFATKATAGQTQINLTSLTVPPEMSANGFTNPSTATLTSAQLLFYRRNLRLWSTVRGDLADYYQYVISSSSTITFVGFTAEEGEIFQGTIDYAASTGTSFVATTTPPATGPLPAGTTDFNTGVAFQVGLYPSTQSGAVLVYRNGQIQVRNAGNATASVSADGDYQEVDTGAGTGQIIRFNRPDPDNIGTIVVVPSGRLAQLPDGTTANTLEAIQGQVNLMATYVAALAGTTTATILGGAPTQQDLKVFGDRVLTLEQGVAYKGLSNTWTAPQLIPAFQTGTPVPSGYPGERIAGSIPGNITLVTDIDQTLGTMTLNKGIYMVFARTRITPGGSTMSATFSGISLTNNTLEHPWFVSDYSTNITLSRYQMTQRYIEITANGTPLYLIVTASFTGTAATGVSGNSTFYAVRIQ